MDLKEFFRQHPKAAIAFSGGVDSSYLLYAALQCGADVRAYYVKGAFQPQFELDDAQRLARDIHAPMTVLRADVLRDETVTANPANRCYYCKKVVFSSIAQAALADGYTVLLDGTNASDDAGDRPGMRALQELQVLLAAAPVRPDEAGDPAAVERGEAIHLGQARLRVSRHAHPDGGEDHRREAQRDGERRGRAVRYGLHRLPRALVRGRGAAAVPGGTAAACARAA